MPSSYGLVRENQREFAARMPNIVRIVGQPELRPSHPFFSAETAAAVLASIERSLPPTAELIPLSKHMAPSELTCASLRQCVDLANELHYDEVEPLHLLAALLSQQSARSSDILTAVGNHREAVMEALRTQPLLTDDPSPFPASNII